MKKTTAILALALLFTTGLGATAFAWHGGGHGNGQRGGCWQNASYDDGNSRGHRGYNQGHMGPNGGHYYGNPNGMQQQNNMPQNNMAPNRDAAPSYNNAAPVKQQ